MEETRLFKRKFEMDSLMNFYNKRIEGDNPIIYDFCTGFEKYSYEHGCVYIGGSLFDIKHKNLKEGWVSYFERS